MADRENMIRKFEQFAAITEPGMPQCVTISAETVRDVLALLREQEPRVMTLEELQAIGTQWNRNTPPYIFVERRSFAESGWMSWGFMHDFVILWGTINAKNYGSKWRVWNLQPTPEQMRDTKWEEDSDASG